MSNIALKKQILEDSWSNPEELTNDDYKSYNGHKGYTHSKWPNYLTIDLQDIHQIETLRFLLWDIEPRAYKYRLLTSTDFLNWAVYFDGSEAGFRGWQEFSFPDKISMRYVRIHCLCNSANSAYHIIQLQVFDENTEQIDSKISNKRVILSKIDNIVCEIGDGLPLTQKMNSLTKSLEKIRMENPIIDTKPFQEIINNFKLQVYDIESLEKSIDSIRREITNPIQTELEEGKRLGKFSVYGFYIGFAGIFVSIFAILNGIFKWI